MNSYLKWKLVIILLIATMHVRISAVETIQNDAIADSKITTLPITEVWRVSGPGEQSPFGLIVQSVVSESGNIFCRDLKNKKYYAFDSNGKFIREFGPFGEGPGEVKNTGGADLLVFRNHIMIQDSDKVLYFDDRGNFIESFPHLGSISLFTGKYEAVVAPQSILNIPSSKAKMSLVNIKTQKKRLISNFNLFKSGALSEGNVNASATIPSITPVMVIGSHQKRLYFGMNNRYSLHITDMNGKLISKFTRESKVKPVTDKEKEEVLWRIGRGLAPRELIRRLSKTFPDKETHFSGIRSHRNRLYVLRSHFVPVPYQEIDVFDSDGKYRHRCIIRIDESELIVGSPEFYKDFLYLTIENEEGDIEIRKYKTVFPK